MISVGVSVFWLSIVAAGLAAGAAAGNLRIASGQGFVVLFTCHFYFAAALA
jgi:hypothetical protein